MPNILPKGLWGRVGSSTGPGTPAIEIGATLLGETTTRLADQVWVGAAGGTPVIVWSATAGSPDSATAIYSPTQVDLAWVPSDPQVAESYNVRRPDGSLAGNVAAPGTAFTDLNPRPLNGAYQIFGVLGGVESAVGTATNVLDLRLQPASASTVVSGDGTATSSVTVNWTNNAAGRPDQWAIYRNGVLLTTIAGTILTVLDSNPPRGTMVDYEVRPVLSGIEGLGLAAAATAVGAMPPTSVVQTATNPPLSNLRLTWAHPGGSRTAYHVERYQTGVGPWLNRGSGFDPSLTLLDLPTSISHYQRIRTMSDGGPSAWVQVGPTEPINDVTPPANANITSFRPESSYGRMVLRFTCPADADFDAYQVQHNVNGGGYTAMAWTSASPSQAVALVTATGAAGQVRGARVLVRDEDGNVRTGSTVTYTLQASPIIVDPSGDLSGTFRSGAWRNDATRSSTELATGWTSSGHNQGCYIYGSTISPAISNKTVVSATIEYYRENEGGLVAAVQPLFWLHDRTARAGVPILSAAGVAEASRLGQGVGRAAPPDTGTFNLPVAFINALKGTTYRGLAMYRGYQGSGNPDNYYALMGIGAVVATGGVVNGRLRFNHLG